MIKTGFASGKTGRQTVSAGENGESNGERLSYYGTALPSMHEPQSGDAVHIAMVNQGAAP
jgi:hypothetical protein